MKKKERKYGEKWKLVEGGSHLLDSIWINEEDGELKVNYATGKSFTFKPLSPSPQ